MRALHKLHLILGLCVSLPLLGWTVSGLLYALPGQVAGGAAMSVTAIDPARVKVAPAEALRAASAHAGRELPITALTLEQKNGRLTYQAIGGLGAGSLLVDAETGAVIATPPPSAKTSFFAQAHFWFFAGKWQMYLLVGLSALAAVSVVTGLIMAGDLLRRRLRRARPTGRA